MAQINKSSERLGERFTTNEGYEIIIIEYNTNMDVVVEIQDKFKAKIHTNYSNCKHGRVKNPYHPTTYGLGYLGEGEFKSYENGDHTKVYRIWKCMFQRCYAGRSKSYVDCTVCEEWYNFQNFANWFYQNYYEVENDTMALDKDILVKNNKIYSPSTCIFVPARINSLFTKSNTIRGSLPIGVIKYKNKYRASCQNPITKRKKYIGSFDNEIDAFKAYKEFKENIIKQIAEINKELIPEKLYNALINYEVEITD